MAPDENKRKEQMQEQTPSWTLGHSLRPLCPRHNYVMNYDEKGISWNDGTGGEPQSVPSYHCNYFGCSVRYIPEEGYFTIVDTPDVPHFVEEPGTNIHRCPLHGAWLYRFKEENAAPGYVWRCGVETCGKFINDTATLQAAS
jgi:hypothetical protein